MSVSLLKRICMFIKSRSKRNATSRVSSHKRTLPFSQIARNKQEYLALFDIRPYTESEWNSFTFVDDPDIGWYCFPSSVTCYTPPPHSTELPFTDSRQALDALSGILHTAEFWTKFIKFQSLEGDRESEGLSGEYIKLYKSLFGLFHDSFLGLVKPHVEGLLAEDARPSQKAAAEILAGLLSSTRYWSYQQLKGLWEWTGPMLGKVFVEATPETLGYWESFVKIVAVCIC